MNLFLNRTPWPDLYDFKPIKECHKAIDEQTDKFLDEIAAIDNTGEYKQKAIAEVKRLGEQNKVYMTKLLNDRGVYS